MKIYNSFNLKKNHKGSIILVGNFDGVHLGHRKLFNLAKKFKKKFSLNIGVLTFDPMPKMFFNKEIKNFKISNLNQKIDLLNDLGVDFVINKKFDITFSKIKSLDFIKKIIFNKLNTKFLFVSNNFKFGNKREGNVSQLINYETEYGFKIIKPEPLKLKSKIISSSLIRNFLEKGSLDKVNKLLKRNWCIIGKVEKGRQIGKKIGFPTCNIDIKDYVLAKPGVYAVRVYKKNSKSPIKGIANLGYRPTFNQKKLLLEVHLFNFSGNLYNKYLSVEFIKFIRKEKKFKNLEKLRKQIKIDLLIAKKHVMSKSQINLPKTNFSMKANLPVREPEILKYWEEINLYQELRNSRKGQEKFILHDGPPYANGNIHMGTALNKILKDIIVKFHQMDGKDSVYVPGWDCHGLPIEWKIEEQYKKNKKNKNDVPIVEFRKECRAFAEKWIDVHKGQFKRLGVVGDWENYYSTMSFDAEAQIVRELGKFLKEGSLYRGFKPVLWSTVEKTALADAEVEYQDRKSDTIYAAFSILSSKIKEIEGSDIIIWTTTPWTIPANKALAYNQNLEYLLINIEDGDFKNKKIVIAKDLLESVIKDCNIDKFQILRKFKGKEFKDSICRHPFYNLGYDYDIPMLEARFVTTEQGTGIVHCAPSHGPDDFNLCLNNGIKAIETVDGDGKYTKNVPLFEGLHIFKSNSVVIEKLKEQNKLLSSGELVHSYPHSWRSKAPLVHRATPQWFISMDSHKLRNKALKALDKTVFYPSKGKERLKAMIETRPDWCVSRQRVWGVPLPIFVHKKTKEILVDDWVNENIASIYEKEGSDCWFSGDPQKFLGDKYKATDYEKLSDIVEVWFDSGSTHSFVLEKRQDLKWPASMYLEGSDQHRGWFHSSLLESCGTRGRAPFESILSHGFVVDGKGLKMSKSVGNVIAPEDILKKYGADILRIWVSSSNYAEDLRIDYSILDQHADSYRKIRNTFRYLLGNLKDNYQHIDLKNLKINSLPELEQFMLHKIFELNLKFHDYFKNYDFHNLYKELLNFCTVDLSAFYFDIRKDTLYCDPINSEKRKSCIIVLNIILNSLLKWFAPILSFTTEEIYKLLLLENKSIHLEKFLKFPIKLKNDNLNKKWIELIKIRDVCNLSIEEKRASKEIGSSLEAILTINLNDKLYKLSKGTDFSEFCITSLAVVTNKDKAEIEVITNKAIGNKCPVCWKINKNKCLRHG